MCCFLQKKNHVLQIRGSCISYDIFDIHQIAGSTIYKSINRICGTALAGFLALGVHWVASKAGKQLEPIIVGVLLFLLGIIFITNNNQQQLQYTHYMDLGN